MGSREPRQGKVQLGDVCLKGTGLRRGFRYRHEISNDLQVEQSRKWSEISAFSSGLRLAGHSALMSATLLPRRHARKQPTVHLINPVSIVARFEGGLFF